MMSTNRIVLEDHQWLVLYTYPNREKAAAREANKLNIETFLPMHTEYRQWHDRVKKVQVPLFRNYVFVRPDAQQKHLIYNINHVSHFVCSEGRPSVVHDKEIWLHKSHLLQCERSLTRSFFGTREVARNQIQTVLESCPKREDSNVSLQFSCPNLSEQRAGHCK